MRRLITYGIIVLGGLTFQYGHFKFMLGATLFAIMILLREIWEDI